MRSSECYDGVEVRGPMGRKVGALLPIIGLMMGACADTSPETLDVPEIQLMALSYIDGESVGEGGFGRIADLEIGEDGHVYVLDELNRTVQVFDGDGTFLRTFGSRGQGPGELERPNSLVWGPEGHLWVVDPGNGRFTVFDRSGGLIGTHLSPDPFFHPLAVGFSGEGLLYSAGLYFEGGSLEHPRTLLIQSEVAGGEIRELRRSELPFIDQPALFEARSDDMVLVEEIPFSSEPVFRLDSHGRLWYAQTREPWVHRWSSSGHIEQTLGREFSAPRVTEAERRELLESEEFAGLRVEAGPALFAEFASVIPDTKPHLKGFFFDDLGNVWVIRSAQGKHGSGEGTLPVDVYDPTGTLIATAQVVLEAEPRPRIRNGRMATVTSDELGVQSVAIYRVPR